MRGFVFAFAFAFLLALGAPSARAQEEPAPPVDNEAEYQALFQQGLDLLRAKKLDAAVKAFEACVKLFPDRAVSYYNVACAHALAKHADKACEWLKKSFDRGFLDLGHVARDTDLDPIREDEGFKTLLAETTKKILASHPAPERIVPKARPEGRAPLVVYVHRSGADLAEVRAALAKVAEAVGAVVLLPRGSAGEKTSPSWDTTAETCVVADVEAALRDEDLEVDPARVVLAGELDGANVAWTVAAEHGWTRVVVAAGVGYDRLDSAKAKGFHAYLVAPRVSERALDAAAATRDDLLAAGGKIFVERHDERSGFPGDLAGCLERGVRWVLGDGAKAPDKGGVRNF